MTYYANERIDKMEQNNIGRLCGDEDKTINHIICECSKLPEKDYKTKLGWEGDPLVIVQEV